MSFREVKGFVKRCIMRLFCLLPMDTKKIVFANFSGKRYGDSPRSVTEEILRRGMDCKIVWLLQPWSDAELPEGVIRKSFAFFSRAYQLATAKIWVDSHTKDTNTIKRKGTYYIHTRHGNITLKKIELDAENAFSRDYIANVKHNAQCIDLFISGSTFGTQLEKRAFGYQGKILECGCPKNDIYFKDCSEASKKVRTKLGISESKKILLYAPTFRENHNLEGYHLGYPKLIKAVEEKFGHDWCVLVRLHPEVMAETNFTEYNDKVINATGYDYMQDLLAAADILVTDYSSTMFEFPLSGKPVFLFSLDYEEYMRDRGMYFDYFSLPFPVGQSNDELIQKIQDFSDEEYQRKLKDFWREVGLMETGNASSAVVDVIEEKLRG